MKKSITLFHLLLVIISTVNAQWTQLNSGTTENLNEIFFLSTDTGYVVGNNGTALKTTDAGTSWNPLTLNTSLHFNDVFFLDTQQGWIVGDSGLICKTTDGGTTWNKTNCDSAGLSQLRSVYFINANVGFAAGARNFTDGLILKTIDGGNTWTKCLVEGYTVFDVSFSRIAFVTPDTGYAISRGLIYKSTDAGGNWFITDSVTTVSGALFCVLEDFYFFSADTGFVVGWYGPLLASTVNGGNHWDCNFNVGQLYTIDFPSRYTGYVAGWGYISKSTDGGNSWTDITNGSALFTDVYSTDFTDDNTGYVCGYYGKILKTTTGGITAINTLNNPSSIVISPNPSNGNFQIQFSSPKMSIEKIEMLNVLGEKVFEKNVGVVAGENKISISPKLGSGIYFLKMILGGKIFTGKVILEK
ncbi:MAG: YCF48-related protein [Bacteroidia bacterium]